MAGRRARNSASSALSASKPDAVIGMGAYFSWDMPYAFRLVADSGNGVDDLLRLGLRERLQGLGRVVAVLGHLQGTPRHGRVIGGLDHRHEVTETGRHSGPLHPTGDGQRRTQSIPSAPGPAMGVLGLRAGYLE